jgi:hypothetical protein
MSGPLPRRRLLSGGAALAATAVLTAPSIKGALQSNDGEEKQEAGVICRWNAKTRSWASRPAKADFGVVFLSTNDATATPPTDVNVQAGDLWRRHPDAGEEL